MNRRCFIAITISLGSTLACGCATTVIPPPAASDSVPVFLTDYGRHSSILLPGDEGKLVEFAFGDFDWFALQRTSNSDGIRALLFSTGSALGKRKLDVPYDVDSVTRATNAKRITLIRAPGPKVDALLDRLNTAFDARFDTIVYNTGSQMWFVRDDEHYWLLHNCNHVTARWLRSLGCEVRGPAIYSNFELKPAADGATESTTPTSIRPATVSAK